MYLFYTNLWRNFALGFLLIFCIFCIVIYILESMDVLQVIANFRQLFSFIVVSWHVNIWFLSKNKKFGHFGFYFKFIRYFGKKHAFLMKFGWFCPKMMWPIHTTLASKKTRLRNLLLSKFDGPHDKGRVKNQNGDMISQNEGKT